MTNDICHKQSFGRMVVEHTIDQLHEVLRKVTGFVYLVHAFPKDVVSMVDDVLVLHVILACYVVEWGVTSSHREKDHS